MNSSSPLETTGRYLVLLPEDVNSGIGAMTNSTGIRSFARAADFAGHMFTSEQLESSEASVFDDLGVAVMTLDPDQAQAVRTATATDAAILAVEPERVVYAINDLPTGLSAEYLKGYRDSINHLIEQADSLDAAASTAMFTNGAATWGLQATKVIDSHYSGLGVKVAVLDTGLDLNHPDFAGRKITSQSFIPGEQVQDRNGHGTHCIGTACGPESPGTLPRYGIAHNAEIFAGKVLSNRGSGSDRGILAGIEWAIANGCQIISMSLGAPTRPGDSFSRIYERVGRRALRRGSLIIAAAGNSSIDSNGRRLSPPNPVGHPANCPSIMAVAAVNNQLHIAPFSDASINRDGGQIDIAGPGVGVYSSWPMPDRYQSISGTSMATPHVSGIAALYVQATQAKGRDLWGLMMQDALRLSLSSIDAGVGLVQAPL